MIAETATKNLNLAPRPFFGSVYQKNLVIGAHNDSNHFGSLKELKFGDPVSFTETAGNVFLYEVVDYETLQPYRGEYLCGG